MKVNHVTSAAAVGGIVSAQTMQPNYNAAPPNLTILANSSLFSTWRPSSHVLPPFGSIGDPCAHYTDPTTGLFHVQWLAGGISGATTDDMVTYVDVNQGRPVIRAGGINDPIAVFDGSVMPIGLHGLPTLLYTSVSFLPIQWTINYTRGSETQSLAVTSDGGKNFTKLRQGPVIPDAPFGLNVTGFRDPYVFQSPAFDKATGSANNTWFTTVSGGVHGVGPCIYLYRQTDPEFEYWEYLGKLYSEPANTTWGDGTWAGRFGFNFEVGNFFQLDNEGYSSTGDVFLSMGAEWSVAPIVPQVSDFRESLWTAGNISTLCNGSVTFIPSMVGKLDWGTSAYAAAGKILPSTSQASVKSNSPDRFILWMWLTSNFYGTVIFPSAQTNWSSSLLLPRELSVGYINNVIYNDLAGEVGSWRVVSNNNDGTVNLSTLKQVIVRETLTAMKANATTHITEPGRTVCEENSVMPFTQSPASRHWLLQTTISFPTSVRGSNLAAGFQIFSSQYEATSIYYQFSNESFIIDRSNSSAAAISTGIYHANEAGRFRLFDVSHNGTVEMETMQLTIVADGGVVEVHVNDRFAISTWIFPWYDVSRNVSFLVKDAGAGEVTFGNVEIWEGLFDAWPERAT